MSNSRQEQEASMLQAEIEILMSERQNLLRTAGAAAACRNRPRRD